MPVPYFRDNPSDDGESAGEEERAYPIFCQYDGVKVFCTLSDGQTSDATSFTKDPNGFLMAVFDSIQNDHGEPYSHITELTHDFLSDDGQLRAPASA
eukprot:3840409-Pyramimonas_sp.AAC.1